VLDAFRSIKGYRVEYALVLAKDYGAPQNRPRVLVVGVRNDINLKPWAEINSGVANGFLPPPTYDAPDLIDLLGDLVDPKFQYGGSNTNYLSPASTSIQKLLRTGLDGKVFQKGSLLTEQDYSNHSEKVVEKFTYMLENNGEIPPHLQTKKFAQRVLPARWGKVGPTITATSLADDYVHFSQARVLTVREWARLQGFPDWYQFAGSRTTGGLRRAGNPKEGIFDRELPKYTQIGNAVPVFLSEKVGLHFQKVL
jgi:DNA (cytosine-5)-methyltransferase 1